MSDLRNIVERLDLLMHSSSTTKTQPSSRPQVDEIVADLAARLGALESEVSELRTLVNHLMTIATWQAKVTATLVGEEAAADGGGGYEDPGDEGQRYGASTARRSGERPEDDADTGGTPQRPRTSTLDEDIDDILGTDRGSSARDTPPPDFGI